MKYRSLLALSAVLVLLLSGLPGVGMADRGDDHERARRALEAGEVLPLSRVLAGVERDYPGQVIEVELERDDGLWFYEVKLIRSGGAVIELKLDARNGELRRIKGRDVGLSDRHERAD